MRHATSTFAFLIALAISGCASSSTIAPEYDDFKFNGESLAIAPFALTYIDENRTLTVVTPEKAPIVSDYQDGDSVQLDFIGTYFTKGFRNKSLINSVSSLSTIDTTDFELRTFADHSDSDRSFSISIPKDRHNIPTVDSDFILFVGSAEADFSGNSKWLLPDLNQNNNDPFQRQKAPGVVTLDYVLWHVADAQPFSWGTAVVNQRNMRLDRPDELQRVADELAWDITKFTPFYKPEKDSYGDPFD